MRKIQEIRHSVSNRIEGHSRRASLWRAAIAWTIWRVFFTLWGYAVWSAGILQPDSGREWLQGLRPATDGLRGALVDIWLRWDTVHYLRIIEVGYGPDERSAFFPLYPFLGRVAGWLFGGENLLGLLLVSNLAALGAFYLFDRLSLKEGPQEKTPKVLFSLVFYPTFFFLLIAYPQSLVLFLSLATYLAARKQRPIMSFFFGIAAGLTHSTAIPLVLLLMARTLMDKERRWVSFLPAIGPMLGFAVFLIWRMNMGYPSYLDLQWSMSGRQIGLGIDLGEVLTPWVWFVRGWHNLLVLTLGVGAILWALRKHKFDWVLFLVILLIIPVVSAPGFEPLDGLARYALTGFPIFFAISDWIPKGRGRPFLLGLAVGANLYLSGLFMLWGFIG
jgi:hypothetical protein